MSTASAHPSRRVRTSQKNTGTSTSRSALSALGSVRTRSAGRSAGVGSAPPPALPGGCSDRGVLDVVTASVLRPAGDVDDLPGDERRLVPDQERDRGRDVL